MKTTGLIVLIAGVILTVFTTFKYYTKEEVIEIGNVEITREKPNRVSWSPWIGVLVMIAGGVIIWQAGKKSA